MDKLFHPTLTEYVITYPCWDQSWTMLVKGDPNVLRILQRQKQWSHLTFNHFKPSPKIRAQRNSLGYSSICFHISQWSKRAEYVQTTFQHAMSEACVVFFLFHFSMFYTVVAKMFDLSSFMIAFVLYIFKPFVNCVFILHITNHINQSKCISLLWGLRLQVCMLSPAV